MKEYEYIVIQEIRRSPSGKTGIYLVSNKRGGDTLGVISWYGPWRQYVFAPSEETVFSAGCLLDLADFIKEVR